MTRYAVIVAGGAGSRMGTEMPKQFLKLKGFPVLWWSMKAFHDEDPSTIIIVVLPQSQFHRWQCLMEELPEKMRIPHRIVAGGNSRTESVKNGLQLVENSDSLVAVHDGARPLVRKTIISDGWKIAEMKGNGVPVVSVTDSLRKLVGDNESLGVDRSKFVAVQTPQVFRSDLLLNAYGKAGDRIFSDDASVLDYIHHPVFTFQGNHDNIKITTPKDMALAEEIMDGLGM